MKQIFIQLPVKDLAKSTAFYEAIGFLKNEMFSDQNTSCVAWSEEIIVLLLAEDFYRRFIHGKSVADSQKTSETLLSLACEKREVVEAYVEKVRSAGGDVTPIPSGPQRGMMAFSFEDPDGHIWQLSWIDTNVLPIPKEESRD